MLFFLFEGFPLSYQILKVEIEVWGFFRWLERRSLSIQSEKLLRVRNYFLFATNCCSLMHFNFLALKRFFLSFIVLYSRSFQPRNHFNFFTLD